LEKIINFFGAGTKKKIREKKKKKERKDLPPLTFVKNRLLCDLKYFKRVVTIEK